MSEVRIIIEARYGEPGGYRWEKIDSFLAPEGPVVGDRILLGVHSLEVVQRRWEFAARGSLSRTSAPYLRLITVPVETELYAGEAPPQ